ncbi:hypothetical protein PVK06_044184 [Gossypium arboreum]|uniref:60S acidic ribosomal protein P1-like n=1 Tax=Gossypium arboreum TaxID=29729 RepID=A0ABR0MS89_GOSAR|nr:hypothetical protein PVK06_044184 [Gossypium arboreum]
MSTVGEAACSYAALILYDDGIPITAEKISTLVKAANVSVESYWPSLFAKLFEKCNIEDLITNVGAAGGGAAVAAAAPVAAGGGAGAAAPPPAEEKKKEEPEEESDDDMGFKRDKDIPSDMSQQQHQHQLAAKQTKYERFVTTLLSRCIIDGSHAIASAI